MTEIDVAIIGAGPAGIQAAIHAARKKVSVILIGKTVNSALFGAHIENYFGVLGKKNGDELLKDGIAQAESFGCKTLDENVISTSRSGDLFQIVTENDISITARAIIIATGISRVKLGVPGEKEFFGKGVSYCAACDCNFYRGKTVVIVGDETEAAVSSELMTKYASEVFWVTKDTKASKFVVDKASVAGVKTVKAKIESIEGSTRVERVVLENGETIQTSGVFIELGAKSAADLAMDLDVLPEMDDTIKVDQNCATIVKGVFACGDVTGKPWQVAKAVGQGAVAGIAAADMIRGA
ncbi:MAG: FAD-dependent oxidoreductase [Candidatus Methanomethylophilaceae archaeon]|jgi:thioredoxin reductase (NADPH)